MKKDKQNQSGRIHIEPSAATYRKTQLVLKDVKRDSKELGTKWLSQQSMKHSDGIPHPKVLKKQETYQSSWNTAQRVLRDGRKEPKKDCRPPVFRNEKVKLENDPGVYGGFYACCCSAGGVTHHPRISQQDPRQFKPSMCTIFK